MEIRAYRESDLETVVALFTASVHALAAERYASDERAVWAPRAPDLAMWRRRLAALRTLVAEDASGLCGFVSYKRTGHIELLYVAPARARRGVGSRLYARAESDLRSAGARTLTTEASAVARPFFERHGFRVVEEQQVRRGDVTLRRHLMRKTTRETDDGQ